MKRERGRLDPREEPMNVMRRPAVALAALVILIVLAYVVYGLASGPATHFDPVMR
jgi:hypothetical protein